METRGAGVVDERIQRLRRTWRTTQTTEDLDRFLVARRAAMTDSETHVAQLAAFTGCRSALRHWNPADAEVILGFSPIDQKVIDANEFLWLEAVGVGAERAGLVHWLTAVRTRLESVFAARLLVVSPLEWRNVREIHRTWLGAEIPLRELVPEVVEPLWLESL